MWMAGSTSAQRPQKIHLPRSRVAARMPSRSSKKIAPVGHPPAEGRASVHSEKSISGRPRAALETSGGVTGYSVVTTPVLKLLRRISNMLRFQVAVHRRDEFALCPDLTIIHSFWALWL